MSEKEERAYRKRVRQTKMGMWLATRAFRNKSLIDRICRRMLERAMYVKPEDDFMRDELIDNDEGFDPEELERYSRGE